MTFPCESRFKIVTTTVVTLLAAILAASSPVRSASLEAADPEERYEALTALANDTTIEACHELMSALDDTEGDLRDRAARAAYLCVQTHNSTDFSFGLALSHGLSLGTAAAQAYLLVAADPVPLAVSHLRATIASDDPPMVELEAWMPPVAASLPAAVALSRLGESTSLRRLTNSPARDEWIFFLSVLTEISDPISLQSLAGAFASDQPILGGVPSHATSTRRLADLAVESFVKRFDIDPRIQLNPAQSYSNEVIADVRRKTLAAVIALQDR